MRASFHSFATLLIASGIALAAPAAASAAPADTSPLAQEMAFASEPRDITWDISDAPGFELDFDRQCSLQGSTMAYAPDPTNPYGLRCLTLTIGWPSDAGGLDLTQACADQWPRHEGWPETIPVNHKPPKGKFAIQGDRAFFWTCVPKLT